MERVWRAGEFLCMKCPRVFSHLALRIFAHLCKAETAKVLYNLEGIPHFHKAFYSWMYIEAYLLEIKSTPRRETPDAWSSQ